MESAGGKFLQCLSGSSFYLIFESSERLGFVSCFTFALWEECHILGAVLYAVKRRSAGSLVVFLFKSLPLISAPFNILFSVLWFHHDIYRYGFTFVHPGCYSSIFLNLEISQLYEYCLLLIIFNLLFWNLSICSVFTPLLYVVAFLVTTLFLSLLYLHVFSISPIFWSLVSIIWPNKSYISMVFSLF